MPEAVPDNLTDQMAALAAQSGAGTASTHSIEAEIANLPTFARGLMQITVPVRVQLAAQRKSIHEIIELGPGSIIKFEKTCDEPLEVAIGDRTIALGEVVKVGDKFGVRISGLVK